MHTNVLERLSERHDKNLHIVQRIKRLLACENCSQNEIEKILEMLVYEYIENV